MLITCFKLIMLEHRENLNCGKEAVASTMYSIIFCGLYSVNTFTCALAVLLIWANKTCYNQCLETSKLGSNTKKVVLFMGETPVDMTDVYVMAPTHGAK